MALAAEHATTTTMPSTLVIIVPLPGQVDEIEDYRKHALMSHERYRESREGEAHCAGRDEVQVESRISRR
jgi:hypothetical protein